jgi:hypothetical protein
MRGLRLRDAEKRRSREFVLANARGDPHPHSLSPSFATFFRLPPSRRSGVGPHDDPPATGITCRSAKSRTPTVTRRKGRR